MCEYFICFEQLVPYTWKKVEILCRAFKFMMPIVKIIVLDLNVEPLGGAHVDLLYIFLWT
jgi:hypothetical protein